MWLFNRKVGYRSDPDPKWFIPDPDPAKSSGSTTLLKEPVFRDSRGMVLVHDFNTPNNQEQRRGEKPNRGTVSHKVWLNYTNI